MSFKEFRLEDICIKITDGVHKRPDYVESGIPFLRVTDIKDREIDWKNTKFICEDDHKKFIKGCHTQPGDILFSKNGTIGKVKVVNWKREFSTFVSLATIKPNHSMVDSNFLACFLSSSFAINQFYSYSQTGTITNLPLNSLKKIKIFLPPLKEQKEMVKILKKAKALIDKRKEQMELMDKLIQSLFYEIFGDPVINPRGWERKDLKEVINTLTDYHSNGGYKELKDNIELKNSPDYALMVRTIDLENNCFEKNNIYVNKNAYEFLKKSKVFGGEIIINKIGSNTGNVYLMPDLKRPVTLGMNSFLLRVSLNADNLYLYYFLKTDYVKNNLAKEVKGAVTKTIKKDAVLNIKILLPDIKIQKEFAKKVKKIEFWKKSMQASLVQLETNFKALEQQAFKGKI